MGATIHTKTLWGRTTGVAVLAMMLSFSATAQTQPQPDAQTRVAALPAAPGESEVPVAVAKELQAMKSQIGQLESRLNDLAASVAPLAAVRPVHSTRADVTLTGKVSCGHCEGIQPMHKGYTQFSWALYSVSQGDDIVLVAADKTYKLQGDKDRLLQFMCDKARVTGRLESAALEVETIGRAAR